MDTSDLAWVAGILEGEGSFIVSWHQNSGGHPRYPEVRVQCNMTDEDVIRKLHAMTGVGTVNGPRVQTGMGWKPFWSWNVSRRADACFLMSELRPLMGLRRGAKIDELFEIWAHYPPRDTWRHGSRQGYVRGCRCDACRAVNAARGKAQRARRQGRLP